MEKEIKDLRSRINFLENLLDLNSATLSKVMETNRKLLEYVETNHLQK